MNVVWKVGGETWKGGGRYLAIGPVSCQSGSEEERTRSVVQFDMGKDNGVVVFRQIADLQAIPSSQRVMFRSKGTSPTFAPTPPDFTSSLLPLYIHELPRVHVCVKDLSFNFIK